MLLYWNRSPWEFDTRCFHHIHDMCMIARLSLWECFSSDTKATLFLLSTGIGKIVKLIKLFEINYIHFLTDSSKMIQSYEPRLFGSSYRSLIKILFEVLRWNIVLSKIVLLKFIRYQTLKLCSFIFEFL